MRVLVTGAAGFIGSRLCHWLIQHGVQDIVGIDDCSSGYAENVPARVDFYLDRLGSLSRDTKQVFRQPFDVIVHAAAYASESYSRYVRQHVYQQNILGSAQLINLAVNSGSGKFIFLSSAAVYGDQPPPFLSDKSVPQPIDPYGISKLATEMDLQHSGLDWAILRLYNVYGPGQSLWEPHRGLFAIWMRQHLLGQHLTIVGDGKQSRSFTYVKDLLPLIWRFMAHGEGWKTGKVYNVGGFSPVSVMHAFDTLCSVISEGTLSFRNIEERPEAKHVYCDPDIWPEQETELEAGLSTMWWWAKTAWSELRELRYITPEIPCAYSLPG